MITPSEHWSHLFDQHNEHRIAVARIFFIIDSVLFKGSNAFNLTSILAIQAVHVAILLLLARRSGIEAGAMTVWSAGFLIVLLFWGYQLENFSWGFQVQFVGVYAAATAAFAALALRAGTLSGLVLAILCTAIAVYSMANGVLVPVLLIALGVWLRLPKWHLAALVVACAALLWSYLSGYQRPASHADPKDIIRHADLVVSYALTYLGGPLTRLLSDGGSAIDPGQAASLVSAALVVGGLGALLATAVGVRLLLGRGVAHPARLALLSSMVFVAATAFLTGLGRVHLPLYQAMSQRYGAGVVVFWSAGALLILSLLPAGRWRQVWMVGLSALCLLVAGTQPSIIKEAEAIGSTRNQTVTAMLAGADDTDLLRYIYPAPLQILDRIGRLREEHLSVFAQDWSAWRGTKLADQVKLEMPGACLGSFDIVKPIVTPDKPGWRVAGWAWDRKAGRVPERIVLADAEGTVVGYALSGSPRPDVLKALSEVRSKQAGWHGHVSIERGSAVTAYAITNGGQTACPLGQPQNFNVHDVVRFAPAAKAGRAVPMESPAIEGDWGIDAFNSAAGPAPVDGTIYASWTGSDAHTGELQWRSGPLGDTRSLLIPVVTGPRTEGLMLRIADPTTGRILSELPLANAIPWQLWEIALPEDGSVRTIEIQAKDEGRGWGQWLAVGQPHAPL